MEKNTICIDYLIILYWNETFQLFLTQIIKRLVYGENKKWI